jgi:CP family cyanate transporter-like MFS transporter
MMHVHLDTSTPRRLVLLTQGALILTAMSIAGQVTLYGGMTASLSQALHVPVSMLGLCSTALYLGIGLAYVPGGQLSDRYGASKVLPLALLLMSLGSLLSVLVSQVWWLLCWRVVVGLGMGATITAAIQRAHRLDRQGGLSQGLFGGAMQAGTALGTLLPPLLAEHGFSWQGIFLLWGIVAAIMTICWAMLPDLGLLTVPGKKRVRDAFRSPAVWRLGLIYASTFGVGQALAPWLVVFCRQTGTPVALAALVGTLPLFAGIFFRSLGGWVLRHQPARVVLRGGLVLTVGALSLLTVLCWLPGTGWGKVVPVIVVLLLLEVGCTVPYAAVQSEAGHIGSREALGPGTAQGVVSQLCAPISALGPALIGWLSASGSFTLSFGLLALCVLLTLLLVERGSRSSAPVPNEALSVSQPTLSQ